VLAEKLAFQVPQCAALMEGDMVGFIALDFILRLILARVVGIAFVVDVFGVHPHHSAADAASLGIPADMIANFEFSCHEKGQCFKGALLDFSRLAGVDL
jgi:hypothetical protein